MKLHKLVIAATCVVAMTLISACSALRPADPIGSDEQYVCYSGSALKYRKPRSDGWPDYLLPRPPAGSCMHR